MKKLVQSQYAKENNILQLPLFYFGRGRIEKRVVEWEDENGKYSLMCNSSIIELKNAKGKMKKLGGIPGSLAQDCYTAIMRIWLAQGMKKVILLNYSDIARELNLDPRSWATHIKDALFQLAEARYTFNSCFIYAQKDGRKTIDTVFSLFDRMSVFGFGESGKQDKRNNECRIVFPHDIQNNLEKKYYQLLDMGWYRKLPEGLPRRLYEFLDKKHYRSINQTFKISEKALCRWLPITDANTTTRRKTLKKIANTLVDAEYLKSYNFEKKKKMCVFVYSAKQKLSPGQENKQEKATTENIQAIYLDAVDWLGSIPYFRKDIRREVALLSMEKMVSLYPSIREEYETMEKKGKRPRPSWVYEEFMGKKPKKQNKKEAAPLQMDLFEDNTVMELYKLAPLKNKSKSVIDLITKYLQSNGFDYVKNTIMYVKSQKYQSFSRYFNSALQKGYGQNTEIEEEKKETVIDIKDKFLALSDCEQKEIIDIAKNGKFATPLSIAREKDDDWWNIVLNQYRECTEGELKIAD